MYRAVVECQACGRVVDVGPFDNVQTAVADQVPGWLVAFSMGWQLRDAFGTSFTVCDECLTEPFRDLTAAIEARASASAPG